MGLLTVAQTSKPLCWPEKQGLKLISPQPGFWLPKPTHRLWLPIFPLDGYKVIH